MWGKNHRVLEVKRKSSPKIQIMTEEEKVQLAIKNQKALESSQTQNAIQDFLTKKDEPKSMLFDDGGVFSRAKAKLPGKKPEVQEAVKSKPKENLPKLDLKKKAKEELEANERAKNEESGVKKSSKEAKSELNKSELSVEEIIHSARKNKMKLYENSAGEIEPKASDQQEGKSKNKRQVVEEMAEKKPPEDQQVGEAEFDEDFFQGMDNLNENAGTEGFDQTDFFGGGTTHESKPADQKKKGKMDDIKRIDSERSLNNDPFKASSKKHNYDSKGEAGFDEFPVFTEGRGQRGESRRGTEPADQKQHLEDASKHSEGDGDEGLDEKGYGAVGGLLDDEDEEYYKEPDLNKMKEEIERMQKAQAEKSKQMTKGSQQKDATVKEEVKVGRKESEVEKGSSGKGIQGRKGATDEEDEAMRRRKTKEGTTSNKNSEAKDQSDPSKAHQAENRYDDFFEEDAKEPSRVEKKGVKSHIANERNEAQHWVSEHHQTGGSRNPGSNRDHRFSEEDHFFGVAHDHTAKEDRRLPLKDERKVAEVVLENERLKKENLFLKNEKKVLDNKLEDISTNQIRKLKEELLKNNSQTMTVRLSLLEQDLKLVAQEKDLYQAKYKELYTKFKKDKEESNSTIFTGTNIGEVSKLNQTLVHENTILKQQLALELEKTKDFENIKEELTKTKLELSNVSKILSAANFDSSKLATDEHFLRDNLSAKKDNLSVRQEGPGVSNDYPFENQTRFSKVDYIDEVNKLDESDLNFFGNFQKEFEEALTRINHLDQNPYKYTVYDKPRDTHNSDLNRSLHIRHTDSRHQNPSLDRTYDYGKRSLHSGSQRLDMASRAPGQDPIRSHLERADFDGLQDSIRYRHSDWTNPVPRHRQHDSMGMFDPFSRLYDGDIPLPRKYTDSYQPQHPMKESQLSSHPGRYAIKPNKESQKEPQVGSRNHVDEVDAVSQDGSKLTQGANRYRASEQDRSRSVSSSRDQGKVITNKLNLQPQTQVSKEANKAPLLSESDTLAQLTASNVLNYKACSVFAKGVLFATKKGLEISSNSKFLHKDGRIVLSMILTYKGTKDSVKVSMKPLQVGSKLSIRPRGIRCGAAYNRHGAWKERNRHSEIHAGLGRERSDQVEPASNRCIGAVSSN
jgi:hypothetical protein